jgi:heparosan-N-sulfate-glucuronate 5-epimerase
MVHANSGATPRRARPRKLSALSAWTNFSLPAGQHVSSGAVRGYYLDFTSKADNPTSPPSWELPAMPIQWGLGCYEHYLGGAGEEWLARALSVCDHLVRDQETGGRHDGGWLHRTPLPHTYHLPAPWLSALPQGQGASLLVRLFTETGDERFADAASRALRPMRQPVAAGGLLASLDGGGFPEEYPTEPPSFVLNGALFAWWGVYDVALALGDAAWMKAFDQAIDDLARSLHRWDLGYWSRYDLFPHSVVNVATLAYHVLHIAQLRATHALAPRPQLEEVAQRFERYAGSRTKSAHALARKVGFRVAVPRGRMVAEHSAPSPMSIWDRIRARVRT